MSSSTSDSLLDIYLFIKEDPTLDIDNIVKCLKVFLVTKFQVKPNKVQVEQVPVDPEMDALERGLYTFAKAFHELKLKETHPIWFVYFENGNIRNFKNDVCLLLANKEPQIRQCVYTILKHSLSIEKTSDRSEKLNKLKMFNKSLEQLFAGDNKRKIRYKAFEQ